LRYRASYDLGYLLFQRAGRVEAERPQDALADLYQAADWFREAVSIRPEEEAARVNLEVSLHRALLLADRLARERDGGLEKELTALATRQREVAAEVVRLHTLSAADVTPDAGERLREEYRGAATRERLLLSDADALAMRSSEEQAALEALDEAELSPEDASRRVQLGGVLHYLHRARERMGQARRQLRERQGERAYRRSAAAVSELERAIDQLRDPVRVLDRLLREENELAKQSALLLAEERGLLGDADSAPRPVWLSREATAESQGALAERVMELSLRLRSGLDGSPPEGASPEQQLFFESAGEAVPFVEAAHESLRAAFSALDGGVLEGVLAGQQGGLEGLAAARERFLDLKGLIEAAFGEEQRIVSLLTEAEREVLHEAIDPLRIAQRRNLERSARIAAHLGRERERALAEAQDPEAENPALQRVELAEQLLPLAVAAMRDAEAALGGEGEGPENAYFSDAASAASDAFARLEVLRRLFFSIVERVREVAEQEQRLQDDTRDAEARLADAGDQAPDVAGLASRQAVLAEHALVLADGLAEQASEAAAADDPAAAEGANQMRLAAEHILGAEGAMRQAEGALGLDPTEFEPARERQGVALEELGKALALLQPPQQQQQQQEPQDPGEDGEQQQEQSPGQEEAQPDEGDAADPGQLLQGVRDREAKRRRDRARRAGGPEDTVEKDW
jgi:hypothetical protein